MLDMLNQSGYQPVYQSVYKSRCKSCSNITVSVVLSTLLLFSIIMHSSAVHAQSDSDGGSRASIMVGLLLSLFPENDSKDLPAGEYGPQSIEVIGLESPAQISEVEQQILAHLKSQNTQALVEIFTKYFLTVDIEKSSETTLALSVTEVVTVEEELALLIQHGEVEKIKELLENEEADLNLAVKTSGYYAFTPITVAAGYRNIEIMELLLNKGADPDIAGDKDVLTPLGHAVMGRNLAMTKLLLNAGASVDFDHRLPGRAPLALWAARMRDLSLIQLLEDQGVDPSLSNSSGWTPLTEAIRLGNIDMALYLVDKNDPRLNTAAEHPTVVGNRFNGKYFPRSNALHLARLFINAEDRQQLIDRILQRTAVLGGKSAVALLQLESFASAASLAYADLNVKRAISEHQQALRTVEVLQFDSTTDAALLTKAVAMLVNLHELSVIANEPFAREYREQAKYLATFNDRFTRWHAMLNIMEHAIANDPSTLLDVWRQKHGDLNQQGWNYDRLLHWSDEIKNEEARRRVLDTINVFRHRSLFK